jgi:hypothetical protein
MHLPAFKLQPAEDTSPMDWSSSMMLSPPQR